MAIDMRVQSACQNDAVTLMGSYNSTPGSAANSEDLTMVSSPTVGGGLRGRLRELADALSPVQQSGERHGGMCRCPDSRLKKLSAGGSSSNDLTPNLRICLARLQHGQVAKVGAADPFVDESRYVEKCRCGTFGRVD